VRETVGGDIRGGRERERKKKDTFHALGEIRVEKRPIFSER